MGSLISSSNILSNGGLAAQFANIALIDVVISLLLGLVTGLLIAFVYRKTFRGVLYSPSFAMTLVMLTLITTPVVMCIKSDIALSMGMVGALSIVRFRTAVKDPMDTAYMFWALTMGILLGAQLYVVGLCVALVIGLFMFLLTFGHFSRPNTYLLVLHYDSEAEHAIMNEVKLSSKNNRLRSKSVTRAGAEMTVEVQVDDTSKIVSRMLDIEGVHDATLVSCQSEAGA